MEFAQLAAVVAVADHGSFTAAARALEQTQPAVSLAVKRLEAELGLPLFERLSTGVVTTTAGEALVAPARRALREREIAREAVRSVSGLTAGHLDLACIPGLAADLVAPIIGAFRRRHPGVTVDLRDPEAGDSVEDLVRRGRSEIGFCALPASTDTLVSQVLDEQELLAVLSPGHARSLGGATGRVPIARLGELPLITAPEGASSHAQLAEALATVGIDLEPVIVTDHRDSIGPLVQAGAGAAVLPRSIAEATRSEWVRVLPMDPPITRAVGLVHRGGGLSPAGQALVELAREGRPGSST
jgi:DNA-binding transcriptional LysR family regulator